MEAGVSANEFWMRLELAAALSLNLLQLVKRRERPIGQWLIGERPEPRSPLQLGRIRRQKHEMNAFRNHQCGTLMPTRSVQEQGDLFVRTNPCWLSQRSLVLAKTPRC